VPDVDAAAAQLGHALGLIYADPSYHSGSVTYNRMVRFANGSSLELVGISGHDKPATISGAEHDYSYFDKGPSQFGFALRSDDLPALVAASKERGGSLIEPGYGEAKLPDGSVRAWMSSYPGEIEGEQFLVVPFVIQYTEGWGVASWRVQGLLEHELDYNGVGGISLTARPDALTDIYQRNFGLTQTEAGQADPYYELDGSFIEMLTINPDQVGGSYRPFYPPQVHTIFLRVADLHDAEIKLRAWGVEFVEERRGGASMALRIDPQATLGLRFALVSGE
jgi:hypothetical protein